MAQLQDEKSSDPLKIMHGEGEQSQQQQAWPKPSAPAFLTKATEGADDQRHDKHEDEVNKPHKKSMLQKVKDRAKTFIHKHGHGHANDHREEEDQHQFEEEEDHDDHFQREEKGDEEETKKEKVEDLNSNFNSSRSSDAAGSAVSNDSGVTNTGIESTSPDTNVVAEGFEPRVVSDRPPSPDAGSAVSPGLDALSIRNLSNDSEAARDREVTSTGIQWTSRDPNVVAEGFEPRGESDRAPSPVGISRGQQELPMAPDQSSPVITPILQSTESENTARPYEDVQSDSYSNKNMAHQVDDIGGTDTALSTPVQTEFSEELPNLVPYNSGKEAPENELYGKDEADQSIGYSEPFARAPSLPEPAISEEPAVETVPIQQTAADRWFDTDEFVAGAPTVKDQNPSPRYQGSEEFGATEPISDELEYHEDQDKVEGTEIKRHAGVLDESQDLKAQEGSSELECDENAGRSVAYSVERSKDTAAMDLGADTGPQANIEKEKERKDEEAAGLEKINVMTSTSLEKNANLDENQSVEEAPYEQDRMQSEDYNYRNGEKGKSYGDKIHETDSTEKNEISSNKLEYGEHQEAEQEEGEKRTEWPSAEQDVGEKRTEWPSAEQEEGEKRTEWPSAEQGDVEKRTEWPSAEQEKGEKRTEWPSAEQGNVEKRTERPSAEQEEGEKRTEWPSAEEDDVEKRTERPSADDGEGAHEESGTATPPVAESVVSSNNTVKEKAEAQTEDDNDDEKTKSDSGAGKGYANKMYETANTAKSAIFSTFGFGGAKTVKDEQKL